MDENKNNQKQIQIEVPNEEMQGKYANLAVITHGPNDFFLDMILLAPNTPKARVQSRIIMTPENAKQLMVALQQNIQKYESTFGEIVPRTGNRQPMNDGIMDFPLPKGQA
ncbi:MAG: DUF3467 domain-containing protein [Muribaculaceae bacterium]|jgi:hypothetical protein|nr:DUF3467 domain-containing protein [Muribaculaceae bacterium]MBQ3961075.1 DUF3467 domain-containing protein [Muribaculaceae bacterium]MBQ4007627.1 DUF3467 domain-containing protein [Muribaculaceae bacterium]